MTVQAKAPGKIMLLGEYAVLDGAPALVAAVGRHARVRLSPRPDRVWRICAQEMGVADLQFTIDSSGRTRWRGGAHNAQARLGLTAHMLQAMLAGLAMPDWPRTGADLEIDTSELYVSDGRGAPVKLGLGSSAAVSVALWRALGAHFDRHREDRDPEQVLRELLEPYSRAQGGWGSGADLAASLYGGMIRYRLSTDGFSIRRMRLPRKLALCFVFSGRAAATPDHLAKFYHWRRRRPDASRNLLAQMTEQAESGVRAAHEDDAGRMIIAMKNYSGLLEQLGEAMGVAVVSRPHRLAGRLAARAGVCYKACGAGGGDLGIAASDDPDRLARLEHGLTAAGLRILPLKLMQDGRGPSGPQVKGQ